jgi:hypothetical protein
MLVVKSFNDAEAAERYLGVIQQDSDVILRDMALTAYRMMIISLDNFQTLSEKKVQNPYYIYYRKAYLNQEE